MGKNSRKGDIGANHGKNGDLFVKVMVEEDAYFKRQGNDIYTNCTLTITQAVLGTRVMVQTLRGPVEVSVDKGTMDGDKKKLPNMVFYRSLSIWSDDF